MKQPKFRGYSTGTKSWHYGFGWYDCELTKEFLEEKGLEPQAMLYTDASPIQCELSSMGQYIGIDDVNGNEVYAGQKVKFEDVRHGISGEGIVDISDASFCIVNDIGKYYRWIDYVVEII
ncbi:hypothetical protein [Oceanobacillus kimchii]|uniref:YopX protein domain-containing protein n=1 Tax=Oceanobacillus kimchii TaxID=746691 RepID=A0ABQ5TJC3_9BACI|nr:hypothetical protein [Oceanobacillus kimchii]GLO66202.1 hypothetical protein MACH08_19860 [Oceanobacillus kimchii]